MHIVLNYYCQMVILTLFEINLHGYIKKTTPYYFVFITAYIIVLAKYPSYIAFM